MTKIHSVKMQLYEMIVSGQFPNGKLPGERELALLLQAGRNTIRTALQELSESGLIERHRRRGTLIRNYREKTCSGLAGLIMRTEGYLCEACYNHILTQLISAGYSVQTVSTSPICRRVYKHKEGIIDKAILRLLCSNPEVLVVDGYINRRIPQIEAIKRRKPVMFDFYDSPYERDFSGVWFDYRKAGYLAGKFLIEKGCRRPVLFSQFVPPYVRFNSDAYSHHCDKLIIQGFRQAMTEGGIDSENAVISCSAVTKKEHYSILGQLASHTSCIPDGFCGARDELTVEFLRYLQLRRGNVPKDITLVGIGNTNRCQESSLYPFSSVDLNPEILAQAIVQQAGLEPGKREDILIEPTLIERQKMPLK